MALSQMVPVMPNTDDPFVKRLQTILVHACQLVGGGDAALFLTQVGADEAQLVALTGSDLPPFLLPLKRSLFSHLVQDQSSEDPPHPQFTIQQPGAGGLEEGYLTLVLPLHPPGLLVLFGQPVATLSPRKWSQLESLTDLAAALIEEHWSQERQLAEFKEQRELKNAFIHMAIHNLRTPLNNAQGFLDLLISELPPLSDAQTEWLRIIHRSHNHMEELAAALLRYEQLTGQEMLEWEEIDLNQLAKAILTDAINPAQLKKQTLQSLLAPQPVRTQGSRLMLQETIEHLLANAITYTPNGGLIQVRTWCGAEDKCYLSVSDSGPGIPPNQHEQIFRPFVRLHPANNPAGFGFGLSLTKSILERHNGSIELQSTVGQGSTFTLCLPSHTL